MGGQDLGFRVAVARVGHQVADPGVNETRLDHRVQFGIDRLNVGAALLLN